MQRLLPREFSTRGETRDSESIKKDSFVGPVDEPLFIEFSETVIDGKKQIKCCIGNVFVAPKIDCAKSRTTKASPTCTRRDLTYLRGFFDKGVQHVSKRPVVVNILSSFQRQLAAELSNKSVVFLLTFG